MRIGKPIISHQDVFTFCLLHKKNLKEKKGFCLFNSKIQKKKKSARQQNKNAECYHTDQLRFNISIRKLRFSRTSDGENQRVVSSKFSYFELFVEKNRRSLNLFKLDDRNRFDLLVVVVVVGICSVKNFSRIWSRSVCFNSLSFCFKRSRSLLDLIPIALRKKKRNENFLNMKQIFNDFYFHFRSVEWQKFFSVDISIEKKRNKFRQIFIC